MSDYDKTLVADKETPAFKIFKDENSNILAQVGKVQMPLKALISNLLARKLKFCEHIRSAPKQKVTIIFFEMKCWKCGTLQYCYTVEPSLKSVCNCDFDVERSSWDDHDIDKHPGVYAAVQDFLQTEEGRQLKVGPVKKRYSRTVADSYLSHGCYYCDAIFGDFHLIEEKLYAFTGVYTIIDNALMSKPIWWILRVFHHVLLSLLGLYFGSFRCEQNFSRPTVYCFLKVGNAPLSS